MQARNGSSSGAGSRWWRLLLIVPVVGPLWVPWYNSIEPTFAGIPFFYWYLFLWVPISVALTALVYFKTRDLL
jgi:hypothetical protein